MTAIEIQAEFLQMAKDYYQYTEHNEEIRFILTQWEAVLQRLTEDPMRLVDRVDWVLKKEMLERRMNQDGLDWNAPEIREMDIKYHDIHPERGLFNQLQSLEVVIKLIEDDRIEHAKSNPPRDTRAKVRNDCIKAAQKWRIPIQVEWDRVNLDRDIIFMDDPLDFYNIRADLRLSDGQTLGFLKEMSIHPDLNIRKRAFHALSLFDEDNALDALFDGLDDRDWSIRSDIIQYLEKKNIDNLENLLNEALRDDHFIVRCRAIEALRKLR